MIDMSGIIHVVIYLATAIKTSDYDNVRYFLKQLRLLIDKLKTDMMNIRPQLKEHRQFREAALSCYKVDLQLQRLLRFDQSETQMSGDINDPRITSGSEQDSDSDDDVKLSATAIAALQEFYIEQGIEEELLNKAYSGQLDSFQPRENWQLSQFWYDARTADVLAREALEVAGDNGCIACVSSPTVYKRIRELKPSTVEVKCFEYDQRFKMYGQDFIFYDFNDPLNLDVSLKNHFDIVVSDPPFLSEECLTQTAITVKFLAMDKIILCTGAVMEALADNLLQVQPCEFKPTHQKRLENEFLCFSNYESERLNSQH